MVGTLQAHPSSMDAQVVAEAVMNAADRLHIPGETLAKIVGLSPASVSRLRAGAFDLARDAKAFELSILFVRLYRSLDAIVGGDTAVAAKWLRNTNTALDGKPFDLIQSISGLWNVLAYLDTRRAQI